VEGQLGLEALIDRLRATLVTLREEGSVEIAGHLVRIVPAWRWLLEPGPA